MFFNNNLEKPDVFLDEGIMFKVSPNPGLNLTRAPSNNRAQRFSYIPSLVSGDVNLSKFSKKNPIFREFPNSWEIFEVFRNLFRPFLFQKKLQRFSVNFQSIVFFVISFYFNHKKKITRGL